MESARFWTKESMNGSISTQRETQARVSVFEFQEVCCRFWGMDSISRHLGGTLHPPTIRQNNLSHPERRLLIPEYTYIKHNSPGGNRTHICPLGEGRSIH